MTSSIVVTMGRTIDRGVWDCFTTAINPVTRRTAAMGSRIV